MIHVQLLQAPNIDLALFSGLTKEIHSVDARRGLIPTAKFHSLCNAILGEGRSHLYATLYARVPAPIFPMLHELVGFDCLRLTVATNGMNTDVIASGALDDWSDLVQGQHDDAYVTEFLSKTRNVLRGYI